LLEKASICESCLLEEHQDHALVEFQEVLQRQVKEMVKMVDLAKFFRK